MNENVCTRKRFQEVGFIEAAMFGFIVAQKFYNDKGISFTKAAENFCTHFNIDVSDIDLNSAKMNFYRTQQKVKDTIESRKVINPFPSQVTEVMKELNFMLSENNLAIANIMQKCEYIQHMINKIETDGRR